MPRFLVFMVIALSASLVLVAGTGPDRAAAGESDEFAFGVIVDTTDVRSMRLAQEAGFTHAKLILHWAAVEPSPGDYRWNSTKENDFDNIMKPARDEGIQLVVRVDGVPGWAGGSPARANLDAVRDFYENLARYGAGTVVAYEILNEPNLPREWGGSPSAGRYTAFLKAAYRGIKAGDEDALVIGGGPSPNTGGSGGTIEDFDFLNGMYDAGAKGFMDVLGVHNYGGNSEPERDPHNCGGICFRRAELYRELMVRRGDADRPIWMTEWGYLLDPGRGLGQYDWMKVSAKQQADYILRAHRYAEKHWPWMTGSLLSNLDASTSPYHTGPEDGLPWFAILNPDYSPRPAYTAFQTMRAPAIEARRRKLEQERLARERAEQERIARERAEQERLAQQPPAPSEPSPAEAAAPPPAEPEAAAPAELQLRVTGTDGQGLILRAAPSRRAPALKSLREGTLLVVSGDPQAAEGFTWRNVRDPDGATGWVAEQFVAPL